MYEINIKLEGIETEVSLYESVKSTMKDNSITNEDLVSLICNNHDNILSLTNDSEFKIFNPNLNISIDCSVYISSIRFEIEVVNIKLNVSNKTSKSFEEIILNKTKKKKLKIA